MMYNCAKGVNYMNIGILYVATGRYICFWDEFYTSAKKYLFPNDNLKFFVFTDAEKIEHQDNNDVVKIFAKSSGWPESTCDRFSFFADNEELYKDIDYLYHFNANMKFIGTIDHEIIPKEENGYICATLWLNHKLKGNPEKYPYDRNPKSLAYIPYGEGKHYFMGGVHGGRTKEYLQMCRALENNMKEDFANGVMAAWHDESHINKYLLDKNPLIIQPQYAIPENWKFKGYTKNIKGLLLDKKHWRYGGIDYLRGITDTKITPFKYWMIKIAKILKIKV